VYIFAKKHMSLPEHLTIAYLKAMPEKLVLSSIASQKIAHNRAYLDEKLSTGNTYYGINTGFGSLCNVRIQDNELSDLQHNLVCSHACGMGDRVPVEIVRLMLLLKVHGLSQGYSGIRTAVVQRLVDFYNHDIIPVVFELGSLGASGDLAPLAHLCLPIFGQGQVTYKGTDMDASAALKLAGLEPLPLVAKEGLALLNGTQFMSSYLSWCLLTAQRLLHWADAIAALNQRLGLPPGLAAMGITEADLAPAAAAALRDHHHLTNPRTAREDDYRAILHSAFHGTAS